MRLREIFVIQPHHFHRLVVAVLQAAAVVDLAGVAEAALFHYAARGGVVHKEVAPDGAEPFRAKAVVDHQLQRLGADAAVPVRLGNPVARLDVVLADVDVAFTVGVVADTADGLARLLQLDSPDVVAMEDGADDFEAFVHTFVGRPSRAGTHIGVGSVPEEGLGIVVAPGAQDNSVSLQHFIVFLVPQTFFCEYLRDLREILKPPRPSAVGLVLFAEVAAEAAFLADDLRHHDGKEEHPYECGLPGP